MLFNNFINIFNTFIMELANRIAEVIKYSNLSVRAFGIKCGIAQALMDKYSKGISNIGVKPLTQILRAFPEISADWMLFGDGDMLRQTEKKSEHITALLDTIKVLQDALKAKDQTIQHLRHRIKMYE